MLILLINVVKLDNGKYVYCIVSNNLGERVNFMVNVFIVLCMYFSFWGKGIYVVLFIWIYKLKCFI